MKQVTMYEAVDGTLHKTKADALVVEARKELEEMLSMESKVSEAIEVLLANPHDAIRVLQALADETEMPTHMNDD